MATPSWFSAEAYLTNKLATLPSSYGITTLPQLMVAFEKAGFAGADGAYKHFQMFGDAEGISPNAYFNATQYMQAKAVAALGSASDYNVGLVASAFANLGMSAWDHYQKYNATEDINPSNAFSEDVYLAAKAALAGSTATAVKAAITGAVIVLHENLQSGALFSRVLNEFGCSRSAHAAETHAEFGRVRLAANNLRARNGVERDVGIFAQYINFLPRARTVDDNKSRSVAKVHGQHVRLVSAAHGELKVFRLLQHGFHPFKRCDFLIFSSHLYASE